ncbi:MAG: hypothetical protein M1817_003295 [Caeruleum heppii]|nr:MAG: hypothetical protein M1817_003295 [Caeruleum heppii]
MSVQSSVFVDGQWVTRTMDINTILAQHNEREEATKSSKLPLKTSPTPFVGVLSRTLIHSPVIKWIIPARIRHKDRYDVVMVGESFVQIKELRPDGHLKDVATKLDFDTRIRHVNVFGHARKPLPATKDALFKEEPFDEGTEMMDANSFRSSTADTGGPRGTGEAVLPPQILVLSLDTGDLMFLFARESAAGGIEFITQIRPLPDQPDLLDRVGRHVAVDPKSRAMAVAAYQNCFTLYALRPISELRQQSHAGHEISHPTIDPVREERQFAVDGLIVRIEFLHPAADDEKHVILLLAVSKEQRTRLLLYDWDCSQSLRHAARHGENGLPLPDKQQLPLLLIPLRIPAAFLLVTRQSVFEYTRILTGRPHVEHSCTFADLVKRDAGSTAPLCTTWIRPLKTDEFSLSRDLIYLCCRDGHVFAAEIEHERPGVLQTVGPAGLLRGSIDTACASLDIGLDQPDMLIAGGDLSVGGLYLIRAKQSQPECTELLANWTPVIEFVTVDTSPRPALPRGRGGLEDEDAKLASRERLFACTGRGDSGAVTEIRRGLEARIGTIGPFLAGASDIWSLPDAGETGIFLLIGFPVCAELLYISADLEVSETDVEAGGLALDVRTLTATGFGTSAVQVTTAGIHVSRLTADDGGQLPGRLSRLCATHEIIIDAALDPTTQCIVTVVRSRGVLQLYLSRLVTSGGDASLEDAGPPVQLPSDPASLSVGCVGGSVCVFVGTADRTLQLFRHHSTQGLVPTWTHSLAEGQTTRDFEVCGSIAVLQMPSDARQPDEAECLVLCGLRDGSLRALRLGVSGSSSRINLIDRRSTRVGQTSIRLLPDPTRADAAFILCGRDLCRIVYSPADHVSHMIHSIWLTNHNEPSYHQDRVSALARILPLPHLHGSGLEGSLACISGEGVVIADFDEACKTVPRHIYLKGTARRMLFSPVLGLLVVAYTRRGLVEGGSDPTQSALAACSSLQFIHPDKYEKVIDTSDGGADEIRGAVPCETCDMDFPRPRGRDGRSPFGRPGELIYGLLDWTCTDGARTYHFLVVATGTINPGSANGDGRVVLMTVLREPDGSVKATKKFAMHFESQPVYSVAAYGSCSLVFSFGTKIGLRRLNLEERKFEDVTEFSLRSPCIYLTVEGPYVHVTTRDDSYLVLKMENNQLGLHFSDHTARAGLTHLTLGQSGLTLASDKESCLTGLWYSADRQNRSAGDVPFEAELPATITRLRASLVRPGWRAKRPLPGLFGLGEEEGEEAKDIMGFTATGSLMHFTLLGESAWRLLRFVQNVGTRDRRVCALGDVYNRRLHLEPGAKEQQRHVDGDMLGRLLVLGPDALREMLLADHAGSINGTGPPDFSSAQARYDRFKQLVEELMGGVVVDPVKMVMEYIAGLLEPVL